MQEMPLRTGEKLYTLVNEAGEPVFYRQGNDGHFTKATCFEDMMTFSNKIGFSHMMEMAKWSQVHCDETRIKVFPAEVKVMFQKIPIE